MKQRSPESVWQDNGRCTDVESHRWELPSLLPANMPGKAEDDDPMSWTPPSHMKDLDAFQSLYKHDPVKVIWGINKWMADLSSSLCSSDK